MLTSFKHALSSETYKRRSKRVSCVTYRPRRLDAGALCRGMQARPAREFMLIRSHMCCQMIDSDDYRTAFEVRVLRPNLIIKQLLVTVAQDM